MLTTFENPASTLAVPDRRLEERAGVQADLWMVDHSGGTVLRCRCMDVSEHGMRLRAPLGYGVTLGQRYEICSHMPGEKAKFTGGLLGRRWATVVRTQVSLGSNYDHLDVGVVFDPLTPEVDAAHAPAIAAPAPTAAMT